jgi:hypothetical protein
VLNGCNREHREMSNDIEDNLDRRAFGAGTRSRCDGCRSVLPPARGTAGATAITGATSPAPMAVASATRGIDTAIDSAQAAGAAAGDAWRRIGLRIAAQAPVVRLRNLRLVAVVSKRAGNVRFSPLTSALFEQMGVH